MLAAGGFESNREWLREAWGQNERGEWPADNFLIRGTRFNKGVLLKHMIDAGADTIGDPTQAHMVAIDARAPLYDGGICTRIDCVSLGVVVNREAERFYDEGEDFWPKRYAIWGRLVAQQPGQIAYSIIDARRSAASCRRCFRARGPTRCRNSHASSGWTRRPSCKRSTPTTPPAASARFDHTALDDCHTEGLAPAKTHWARPIDTPPFYGYALRPGITFTYLGLKVNETAAVHFGGRPSPNLFVAGEMMAGNVLGKGYTAGVGMSIGTAFGRIAGTRAAAAVLQAEGVSPCKQLEALAREAVSLADGARRVIPILAADRDRGRPADADLQCLPLLRRLLRRVPGDDAPARIRQGRHPLPGQPLPQLRRLPACLPVRAAARVRRQRAAGDGRGARRRPTPTTHGRPRSACSTSATG